jgi:hypothetical protein
MTPGVYVEGIGTLQLDVRAGLEANGWPDTPETRAIVEQHFRAYCRASGLRLIEPEVWSQRSRRVTRAESRSTTRAARTRTRINMLTLYAILALWTLVLVTLLATLFCRR